VKEAEAAEPIQPGVIYTAPPGYHLLVETNRIFALNIDPPENFSRPSIDVLFESAAEAYRSHLLGILLTGASYDGAKGLYKIKNFGGYCIAQDPTTAVMPLMPQSAIEINAVHQVLRLPQIGAFLATLPKDKRILTGT
jgi:two-component system chemotaxis response regulator CheB